MAIYSPEKFESKIAELQAKEVKLKIGVVGQVNTGKSTFFYSSLTDL